MCLLRQGFNLQRPAALGAAFSPFSQTHLRLFSSQPLCASIGIT